MEMTPNLGLPLLHAAQAQKEVTHNEALVRIDLLARPVRALGLDTPPQAPVAGESWLIGAAPTGAWAGQAHRLAGWTEGGWRFVALPEGTRLWAGQRLVERGPSGWTDATVEVASLSVAGKGVVAGQQPAIARPVGGATVDAEGRAAIGRILDVLAAHGLTAAQ